MEKDYSLGLKLYCCILLDTFIGHFKALGKTYTYWGIEGNKI